MPDLLEMLAEFAKEEAPPDADRTKDNPDSEDDAFMPDSEAVQKRKARNAARDAAEEKRRKQAAEASGQQEGQAPEQRPAGEGQQAASSA